MPADVKEYFRSMSFTSADSRWADVYLAAAGRGVSVCGDFLAATTLALVLQEAGHGGLAVSGLLLAATLPIALLAPLAGRLVDRFDSRTLLVSAGLIQAAVCAVLAFAAHPVLIIALIATLACGLAITQPTLAALIPRMVTEKDFPRASGIVQSAGQIGILVAPALAGVLVGQTGQRLPLLIGSLLGGRLPGRWRTPATVLGLLAGSCLAVLIGGATVGSAWLLIPVWMAGGFFNGLLNVCTSVLIAGRVRPESHGRAFAAFGASMQTAGIVGFFVAGPLVGLFDPRVLVTGAGAAGLLAAAACWPLIRREMRSETRQAPPTSMRDEIGDTVAP